MLSPGSGGIVEVSYNSMGDQVSGLQFDVQFDSSALSVTVVPGLAIRSARKNLYGADLSAGWHRTLIAGLNQIPLSDGPLVTLFVNVLPNASAGAYTIGITNPLGADPSGNAAGLTGTSAAIAISGQLGDVAAIQSGGILSAAGLLPGAVSPGEMVTLIGSGIGPLEPIELLILPSGMVSTNLANTMVSFDSMQAPLLYASLNQINLVVPFEVSGKASSLLTISRAGQLIVAITEPVALAAPAIFTQGGTGLGPAAAVNQDGSLNTPSNPAPRGSIISVYLSGAGQTNPLGLTGAINSTPASTVLPTTATIGGIAAEVLYSGPAPGLIAGVSQVNLLVPVGLEASLAAPIFIQVGTASTQDGVAVSVY